MFNVDEFLSNVGEGGSSSKREFGLQAGDDDRASKRARIDEDED